MSPGSRRNEWNGIHCRPFLNYMELHWIKHFKFLLDLASIKNAMKPVSLTFLLDVFMRFMPDSWESCAQALLTILSTNSQFYSLWNTNEKTKNGRSINKMINITRIYHIQRPTNIDAYMYPAEKKLKNLTTCLLSWPKPLEIPEKEQRYWAILSEG